MISWVRDDRNEYLRGGKVRCPYRRRNFKNSTREEFTFDVHEHFVDRDDNNLIIERAHSLNPLPTHITPSPRRRRTDHLLSSVTVTSGRAEECFFLRTRAFRRPCRQIGYGTRVRVHGSVGAENSTSNDGRRVGGRIEVKDVDGKQTGKDKKGL